MQASNAVQKAIYTALTGALGAVPVFDEVPASQGFPYVVIGTDAESPSDVTAQDSIARGVIATVHVWSENAGMNEAKTIGGQVVAALDYGGLTVTDWRHVLTRFEFSQYFQDQDPSKRHGVLRFRVVVLQDRT